MKVNRAKAYLVSLEPSFSVDKECHVPTMPILTRKITTAKLMLDQNCIFVYLDINLWLCPKEEGSD